MADGKHTISEGIENELNDATIVSGLDLTKEACLELISELHANTGTKHKFKLQRLAEGINNCNNFDSLSAYLKSIFDLTRDFLKHDLPENHGATKFFKEVIDKLTTLEKELTSSFESTGRDNEIDQLFSNDINADITGVTDSMETITTFDELKSLMSTKLNKIRESVDNKIQEYNHRIENSRKEHERIQNNFKNLIVQIREKDKILEEQSRVDPLTGIFNRRVFEEKIALDFDSFHRYNKPFSLIFFDIDNFKDVNDKYGHEAGDKVLKGIAKRVSEMVRKPDIFARYGGEEFVVILPETDVFQGICVASKLRNGIEKITFEYKNDRVYITVSLGVTEIKEDDSDYQSTVNRADKYMYVAKKKGRNQVVSDIDVLIEKSNQ